MAALRALSIALGVSVGCCASRVSVSSAAGRDSDSMSSVRALLISLSAARSCWNSSERMTLVSWVSVQLWMSQRSSAESEPSVRSRVSCAVSLSGGGGEEGEEDEDEERPSQLDFRLASPTSGRGRMRFVDSFVPWIIMGVFSAMMMGGTRVVLGGRGVCAQCTGKRRRRTTAIIRNI